MTPESALQANLLFSLVLLLGTVGNTLLIWRRLAGKSEPREISPNPLTVQEATRYVTKEESSVQHQNVMERLTRLEGSLSSMQASRHTEVEALRVEVRADFGRVHQRIDDLPDRIIATLKNTGAIT